MSEKFFRSNIYKKKKFPKEVSWKDQLEILKNVEGED